MSITNPTGSKNLIDISTLSVENGKTLGWNNNKISNQNISGNSITRIDSNDLTYTIYKGVAVIGTLESDSVWNIKRIIETPGSIKDVKNAIGSWTNRTSLVYS